MTPDEARSLAARWIESPADGLVLFGSCARGDNTELSDIDILQVAETPAGPYHTGPLSVSRYTLPQLLRLARRGSLFAWHLASEAQALDNGGHVALAELQAAFIRPSSFGPLRAELSNASRLLDITHENYATLRERADGLVYFLARTFAYSIAAELDLTMTFSMPTVLSRIGNRQLSELLNTRHTTNWQAFLQRRSVLAEILQADISNPYGSPEALIVNSLGISGLTVALGCRLLRINEGEAYIELDEADAW